MPSVRSGNGPRVEPRRCPWSQQGIGLCRATQWFSLRVKTVGRAADTRPVCPLGFIGTQRTSRLTLWFVFAVVLLLAMAGCSGNRGEGGYLSAAPGFALESVDGNTVRLEDYRGMVIMLHFWATWCAPCRAAIAHEIEFQDTYAAQGFTVLGLNMDKEREAVIKFLHRNNLNYPTLFLDDETRKAYGGVSNIPLTILVDREGMIRRKSIGYTLQLITSLERTIEALLEEGRRMPFGP